jgi:uncharacterized Tic20 family protein
MSKGRYKIVLEDRVLDGHTVDTVKQNLCRLLKVDPGRIERLFAGAPTIIKKDIDYPTASKYKEALRRAGAVCRIEDMEDPAPQTVPPPLPAEDEAPLESLDRQSPTSAQSDGRHLKPAAAWYIGSFALIILPTVIAGTMMISGMTARLASGIKIPAPGSINVTLNRLDTYVIWSEPLMTGKVRLRPEDDFNITVYDRDSEQQIKILPVVLESTSTTNGVERKSLAKIVIDRPGEYRLNVEGDFPPTTFLLRRSFLSGWQTFLLLPILMGIAGWIIGPLSAAYIFVKRSRYQQRFYPKAFTENEERKWAMLSHIGTFAAFFVPFGNLIAPLIILLVKKEESDFVVHHSKESLNFQISILLYSITAGILMIVFIGFFLLLAISLFYLIMVIMAGLHANDGHLYRYPFTIRFIK